MDSLKKSKLVPIIAVLAILVLAYFLYTSLASQPAGVTSTDTGTPISQQLLITLSNLHSLRLDGSIFQNPVFVSLSDFGVVIPPEPVGRRNPFLPASSR